VSASPDCNFCRIVARAAPASLVYQDADVVAFLAVPQAARGHVLIVPREHYATCVELPPELAAPLFGTTLRIARAVHRLCQPDGMTLAQNNGRAAGQSVFHVHIHVLPRTEGVRVNLHDPKGRSGRGELDRLAGEISAALEQEG